MFWAETEFYGTTSAIQIVGVFLCLGEAKMIKGAPVGIHWVTFPTVAGGSYAFWLKPIKNERERIRGESSAQ